MCKTHAVEVTICYCVLHCLQTPRTCCSPRLCRVTLLHLPPLEVLLLLLLLLLGLPRLSLALRCSMSPRVAASGCPPPGWALSGGWVGAWRWATVPGLVCPSGTCASRESA
jgi:hypothetical protein